MELVKNYCGTVTNFVNDLLRNREPWQIVVIACGSTIIFIKLRHFLIQDESLQSRLKKTIFSIVRRVPSVRRQIDAEMATARRECNLAILGSGKRRIEFVTALPQDGLSYDDVFKKLEEYQQNANDEAWKAGRVSGCVYSGQENLTKLGTDVYKKFSWTNPLHPDVFPDIRQMDAEIVRMCCTMFHGDSESCGTTSSGGTESLILACIAARNRAFANGIDRPQIITSSNAHPAFDKAVSLLRLRHTKVPLDPNTMALDVKKMRRAITRSTCLLVCSTPDYPYGQIDPVAQVAELGVQYKIPVHVDACLGGFLIAFMDKAGFPLDPFDFRLEGVTSISCDTHKYGFTSKGISVILYRNSEYRKHQYSFLSDWTGGIYATPTLAGSRPGVIIANCWATLMYMGENSYIKTTRDIVNTARYIIKRLGEIKEVSVVGNPQVSLVAIMSDTINVFQLSTLLSKKGWHLTTLQRPAGLHIMLTLRHTADGVADSLIADIKSCIEALLANPNLECESKARIYGVAAQIPDISLIDHVATMYLDALYVTEYPS